MERDRNDRGRYADRIDPDTVMGVFDAREDAARPVTASDVVEELGIARRTAHNKLNALVERGTLETRKVGARGRVWWIPDRRETAADDAEEDARADAVDDGTDDPPDPPADARDGDTAAEEEDLAERVREYLEDTDAPPKTTHGQSATLDVFRHLREHGTAKTGALQDAVYPDYADEWGSRRAMWNVLDRYLADVPGIEKGGYGEWTYTGDDAVRAEVDV